MGQQEHREAQERRRVTGSPSRPKRRSIWLACACVASHSALSSLRLRTTLNLSAELPPQSVGLVAVCTRAQLPHNELPEHGTQHTSYPDGGSCAERAPAASARALLDRGHLVRDGASPLASRAHHCSNTFLFPPSRSLGGRTFLPQKARRRCCCARRTGQTTSRLRCHSGIWSRVRRCLRRA